MKEGEEISQGIYISITHGHRLKDGDAQREWGQGFGGGGKRGRKWRKSVIVRNK